MMIKQWLVLTPYPLKNPSCAFKTSLPYRTARRRIRLRTYSRPSFPIDQAFKYQLDEVLYDKWKHRRK